MSPLIPFYPSIVSPRIIHPMFSNFIRACATAARTCTVHSNSVLKHINVTLQELQRTQLMGPPYRKMIHHHKSQNMPLLKKNKKHLVRRLFTLWLWTLFCFSLQIGEIYDIFFTTRSFSEITVKIFPDKCSFEKCTVESLFSHLFFHNLLFSPNITELSIYSKYTFLKCLSRRLVILYTYKPLAPTKIRVPQTGLPCVLENLQHKWYIFQS